MAGPAQVAPHRTHLGSTDVGLATARARSTGSRHRRPRASMPVAASRARRRQMGRSCSQPSSSSSSERRPPERAGGRPRPNQAGGGRSVTANLARCEAYLSGCRRPALVVDTQRRRTAMTTRRSRAELAHQLFPTSSSLHPVMRSPATFRWPSGLGILTL
jgi:hypothetical protein